MLKPPINSLFKITDIFWTRELTKPSGCYIKTESLVTQIDHAHFDMGGVFCGIGKDIAVEICDGSRIKIGIGELLN